MHKRDKARKGITKGMGGKVAVLGMIERGGTVHAEIVGDTNWRTIDPLVRGRVEAGAKVYTDALGSYKYLGDEYDHRVIDHAVAYVDGHVHTNFIENFWSLLKRGLHGTYVSVEPFHLFRYLDERMFTFNLRELDDVGRFENVLGTAASRLTYAHLTGR